MNKQKEQSKGSLTPKEWAQATERLLSLNAQVAIAKKASEGTQLKSKKQQSV